MDAFQSLLQGFAIALQPFDDFTPTSAEIKPNKKEYPAPPPFDSHVGPVPKAVETCASATELSTIGGGGGQLIFFTCFFLLFFCF